MIKYKPWYSLGPLARWTGGQRTVEQSGNPFRLWTHRRIPCFGCHTPG